MTMVMILMIPESIVTRIMFIMSLKVMMVMIREHDAGDAHVNDQQEDGPLSNDLSRPD